MRIPRDISSTELIKLLKTFGYQISRQKRKPYTLNHFPERRTSCNYTNHNPIRLGTLSSILFEVADHFKKTKEEIANEIF